MDSHVRSSFISSVYLNTTVRTLAYKLQNASRPKNISREQVAGEFSNPYTHGRTDLSTTLMTTYDRWA